MIELYETHFGINNHMHSTNPLASVQYNECENYIDHFLYDTYLELFIYKEINKHTGLTFDDFLDRPRYEIDKIVKVTEDFRKKGSAMTEQALSKLETTGKK